MQGWKKQGNNERTKKVLRVKQVPVHFEPYKSNSGKNTLPNISSLRFAFPYIEKTENQEKAKVEKKLGKCMGVARRKKNDKSETNSPFATMFSIINDRVCLMSNAGKDTLHQIPRAYAS